MLKSRLNSVFKKIKTALFSGQSTWKGLIAVFTALVFFLPSLLLLLYHGVFRQKAEMTDLFSYSGSILSVAGAISAALMSIWAAKKRMDKETESRKAERERAILPILQLHLEETENPDVFIVSIRNFNDHPALDVYMDWAAICPAIAQNQPCRMEITFNEQSQDDDIIFVDTICSKRNSSHLPSKLTLFYYDVDRNAIEQDFIFRDESPYFSEGQPATYM